MPRLSGAELQQILEGTAFSVLYTCLILVNRHHICGHGFAFPQNKKSR